MRLVSNCRSHVSERKTLNVTIYHHWNSAATTTTTTNTTVVVEDSLPTETSCAADSSALLTYDDDEDAADLNPVGWCVGIRWYWNSLVSDIVDFFSYIASFKRSINSVDFLKYLVY